MGGPTVPAPEDHPFLPIACLYIALGIVAVPGIVELRTDLGSASELFFVRIPFRCPLTSGHFVAFVLLAPSSSAGLF